MDKTILVKRFTAPWCAPCRMLKPIMESLAEQFPQVTFETVDVDVTPTEAEINGVRAIPTVIMFRGGKEVRRFNGALSKHHYQDELEHLTK